MVEGNVDVALATAEEILKYAEEEFEKAIKTASSFLGENDFVMCLGDNLQGKWYPLLMRDGLYQAGLE